MTQAQMYLNRLLQILALGGSIRDEVLIAAERDVQMEQRSSTSPKSN